MTAFARLFAAALCALALAGCAGAPFASVPPVERAAIEARLARDIALLASDEFGGRKPGTAGEEKTLTFIEGEMRAAGLDPGAGGGAWRAPVHLAAIRADDGRVVFYRAGVEPVELGEDEAAAFTGAGGEAVGSAPLVFVGRLGSQVPADEVSGKVVLMLGEPGVSPARRAALFDKGPAAVLTVIADGEAVSAVRGSRQREGLRLVGEASGELSGFVSQAAMARALGKGEWDALLYAAEAPDFAPLELDVTAGVAARNQSREFTSYNVIGKLPGRLPGAGAVLLMGHWDHLGECRADETGDRLCNGAVDNASGIAAMLELARRLGADGPHDRDIYLLATTAEESGLLGARAFAENPPLPLDQIVAALNFDTVAVAPAGSALGFVGEGRTALDKVVLKAIEKTGRPTGNREFAESFVRRQDGWALLEAGVPAVLVSSTFASEIAMGPYLSTRYHRASDEAEAIELGGAIDDLLLNQEIIRSLADTRRYRP